MARTSTLDSETRTCSVCGETKPLAKFHRHRGGRRTYCGTCAYEYVKRWKQRNPERAAATQRKAEMAKYGITPEEYDFRFEAQGGLCAICAQPERSTNQFGRKRLAVDHDHETGEVRGLLCFRCNVLLGHAEDDVDLLGRVVDYLNNPKKVIERGRNLDFGF